MPRRPSLSSTIDNRINKAYDEHRKRLKAKGIKWPSGIKLLHKEFLLKSLPPEEVLWEYTIGGVTHQTHPPHDWEIYSRAKYNFFNHLKDNYVPLEIRELAQR